MISPETSLDTPPHVVEAWTAWFAWFPIQLYMSPRMVWLRTVHRRYVRLHGVETCDYTDSPEDYPCPVQEP